MTERRLSGRRLTVRPLEEGDAQALHEAIDATRAQLKRRFAWADAAGPDHALEFVKAKAEALERGESATFGVFETKSGRVVGVAALDPIVRETLKAQLGLWIRSDEQDKGYAGEAGKLVVDHAFRKLLLHRLFARIDPANRAARKVLKRLGFRYEGCLRQDKRLNNRWIDQECWGIVRPDWKPQAPGRKGK